jgi:hypothetical protein
VERLAKISGAGPVYRTHASPVLGPRSVSGAGNAVQDAKDGGNPIVKVPLCGVLYSVNSKQQH